MSLGERFKKWLLPTSAERKEQMRVEEIKRQARYEKLKAEQEHKLSSLRRQADLARGQAEIAERQKEIRESQAKVAESRPTLGSQFAGIENTCRNLDKLANELSSSPGQKKPGGAGANAS